MSCCGYHRDHGGVPVWTVSTAGGVGNLHPASGYYYVKKTGLGSERTVTEMGGWAEAWQGALCSGSGAQHFTELVT